MMQRTALSLAPPEPFNFVETVQSHGWHMLAPFRWDANTGTLSRPELISGNVVDLTVRRSAVSQLSPAIGVDAAHVGKLTQAESDELSARVKRMLNLDVDLGEFYRLCEDRPGFSHVVTAGKGRLLRGSSLFEDIVKTILTTNVNWAGTVRMVNALVEAIGIPLPRDSRMRTFPTAEQIAAQGETILMNGLGMGYRAAYVVDLARRLSDGSLNPANWEAPDLEADHLYRELRAVRGIGDYAASSIMMLLGHSSRIPVDSMARKYVSEHFYGGSSVTDAQVAGFFSEFGQWRGLAFWLYDWPA